MNLIKIYLLPLVLLITLSGCSTANLSYNGEQLALQVDKQQFSVNGELLYTHKSDYTNLYLQQDTLRLDAGNIVTYEEATTDINFEFNLAVNRAMKAIFDAKDIKILYSKSFFFIFQVILKDNSVLNIAAQQHDDQRLSFVYGMSTSQTEQLLTHLDAQTDEKLIKDVIIFKNEKNTILSKWSVELVHFTPIITPARYLQGR
ncbi:MAG: hypothetical protein U9P71_03720 [Campylobacterota bacterium]|nr:hypothetical protein [Campylobacterota bacterium]